MIIFNSKPICGIYKIINKINGNFYIGSSQDIYARWANHRCSAKQGSKKCPYLYSAMRKYGIENFEIFVVIICEIEFLSYYEFKYLEFFFDKNITYNTTLCTDAPFRGRHHTEETRKLLGDMKKGSIPWNKGKKYAVDIITKIKHGMLKNNPLKISTDMKPNILKMYFDEFKTIKAIAKKYNVSAQPITNVLKEDCRWHSIERRGAWNKGKNHSEKTKNKISKIKLGMPGQPQKLTTEKVIQIRNLYTTGNYSHADLARLYNCNRSNIRAVINFKIWKNVNADNQLVQQ